MLDLANDDIYLPNTKNLRDLLERLKYSIKPISSREVRSPTHYRAICFSEWVEQFERLKKTNKVYYCMNKPTLTEDQAIFLLDILHMCPDYATFKEALEGYVNSNP